MIATPMPSAIIFDDDSGDVYCDSPCDALLIERKDGSHICSYCGREYLPGAVKKHKRHLGPIEDPYDNSPNSGPLLISMTDYTNKKKKKVSFFDKEDKLFESKPGRHFLEHEDWPPAEESERER